MEGRIKSGSPIDRLSYRLKEYALGLVYCALITLAKVSLPLKDLIYFIDISYSTIANAKMNRFVKIDQAWLDFIKQQTFFKYIIEWEQRISKKASNTCERTNPLQKFLKETNYVSPIVCL